MSIFDEKNQNYFWSFTLFGYVKYWDVKLQFCLLNGMFYHRMRHLVNSKFSRLLALSVTPVFGDYVGYMSVPFWAPK